MLGHSAAVTGGIALLESRMSDPNALPPSNDPSLAPPPVNYAAPGLPPTTYLGPPPDADARNMAMVAHLLNVTLLGPLLVYLLKKDSSPFVAHESRESLNFSITCLLLHVGLGVVGFFLFCIPSLLSLALFVVQIVFGIIAGLKAKEGVPYRYPATLRLVS